MLSWLGLCKEMYVCVGMMVEECDMYCVCVNYDVYN